MTAGPRVGEQRELVVCEEVTRTRIVQYAGASGDFSILHTDEPAAQAAGHPALMAHGMMTMALSSLVLTRWLGVAALRTLGGRFTAPVWPGDRLTSRAVVEDIETVQGRLQVRLRLESTNQHGERVLTGYATAVVDTDSKSG